MNPNVFKCIHLHFQNRVEDSVELFKRMFYNEFLLGVQFILFLNKKDLFEERLKIAPLEKYFPTFQGDISIYKYICIHNVKSVEKLFCPSKGNF